MNIKTDLTNVNYRSGRSGNSIEYIVCHFTGNQNDTAAGNANYFRDVNRQASANYFVDDNEIVEVVRERDTSWHCGDGYGRYGITNSNSIGIEMCATNGDISEETIENTLWLVKSLMNKYGIDINHVVRHYDASRKCCPSPFAPNNWSRWWEFKNRLSGENNSQAPTSKPSNEFSTNARALVALDPRDNPSNNYNDLGEIYKDERFRVLAEVCDRGDFLPIVYWKDSLNRESEKVWIKSKQKYMMIDTYHRVVNVGTQLDARYEPSSNSATMGYVKNGERLYVHKVEENYALSTYFAGDGYKTAWFTAKYLERI